MRLFVVVALCTAMFGCGGGISTSASGILSGNFVDAPVKGLCYNASPSGLSGTTASDGGYQFKKGDTVSFAIPNDGSCSSTNAISLGAIVAVDPSETVNSLTHVLGLPNGRRIAEVLNALNLGSSTSMDITNLSIPTGQASRLAAYMNNGALPTGIADNGTLLQSVQAATTHPTGTAFILPVNPTTFNADVSTHLDVTLNRVTSTSTLNVSDIVGRLYFQADSNGKDASIGTLSSITQMMSVEPYDNTSSLGAGAAYNQIISVNGDIVNIRPDFKVTVLALDAQRVLYKSLRASVSGSGSLNFLAPITLSSVAGKRVTFEGADQCNGVMTEGVFDFNASGTVMTNAASTSGTFNVSTDSSLPGLLKMTNPRTGTTFYTGLGMGGSVGKAGSTMFWLTTALNPGGTVPTARDEMKPFGSFKIKANPLVVPICAQPSLATNVKMGTLTTATGSITVKRNGSSTTLQLGGSILTGDVISTPAGGGEAMLTFTDGSILYLGSDVRISIDSPWAGFMGSYAYWVSGFPLQGRRVTSLFGNISVIPLSDGCTFIEITAKGYCEITYGNKTGTVAGVRG